MNVRDEIKQALETGLRFSTLKVPDQPYDIKYHEKEVAEELKHHIGNVRYSKLFLKQLGQLHGTDYVEINNEKHPYDLSSIYWIMEDIIKQKLDYKIFKGEKSPLSNKNIFHVHHHQSFYMARNIINYYTRTYTSEESVRERINFFSSKYPNHNPKEVFCNSVLLQTLNSPCKTGQWIIFQYSNNLYYFICLALHNTGKDNNDKLLFRQIEHHLDKSFYDHPYP
jgi:hypothetical protein